MLVVELRRMMTRLLLFYQPHDTTLVGITTKETL
jgi:hypothetical protein